MQLCFVQNLSHSWRHISHICNFITKLQRNVTCRKFCREIVANIPISYNINGNKNATYYFSKCIIWYILQTHPYLYFSISTGPNIITQARPGNEFVSIDGKRTYFDIGPTVIPQQQGNYIGQNIFNNNPSNNRRGGNEQQHLTNGKHAFHSHI